MNKKQRKKLAEILDSLVEKKLQQSKLRIQLLEAISKVEDLRLQMLSSTNYTEQEIKQDTIKLIECLYNEDYEAVNNYLDKWK